MSSDSSPAGLAEFAERVSALRRELDPRRCALVVISGIDGAGKGWFAERLGRILRERGCNAAVLGVDGWLNLPEVRFGGADPGEHFYRHALRLDELFERLVEPLRARRSIRLEGELAHETARVFHRHVYEFRALDVLVLEGIFLLKREYQARCDLSLWLDCSFETALERALARAQEGLSPRETARAYHTVYFPAQRIHLERDAPRQAASAILVNDPRLDPPSK